jgi:hypothetical protein
VMTGAVGLGVYALMYWTVLHRCRAVWRNVAAPSEERALCLGVGAASVAMIVHSIFLNSLLYPFLMQALWVLWGLTYVVAVGNRTTEPSAAADRPGAEPRGLSLLAVPR